MQQKFAVLDLFSGIGGFSLGLERTGGFVTKAFCEVDPYCKKVLRKHWPKVPIYDDIKTLTAEKLRSDGISVDVLTGGFPCQDISNAGRGAGLKGERSGLWFEFHRLINEIKPSWVIIENVAALRSRGLDEVLRSLFEIGYDAEWDCIPACAVGLPHRRDRIWIVAYDWSKRRKGVGERSLSRLCTVSWSENERRAANFLQRSDLHSPRLCGTGNGVPNRTHRLRALGNAVVPQIPQLIGEAILAASF